MWLIIEIRSSVTLAFSDKSDPNKYWMKRASDYRRYNCYKNNTEDMRILGVSFPPPPFPPPPSTPPTTCLTPIPPPPSTISMISAPPSSLTAKSRPLLVSPPISALPLLSSCSQSSRYFLTGLPETLIGWAPEGFSAEMFDPANPNLQK